MELWKQVPDFAGYEVSSLGNVRSTKQKIPRILKPGKSGTNGEYRSVYLSMGGKIYPRLIHRLMLEAFVCQCPEGQEARHINGNASDNRLENLEWATHMDNMQDKVAHGTLNRNRRAGTEHEWSRLTPSQVEEIRVAYAAGGVTHQQLADEYGTSRANVGLIINRKNWKKV